MDWLSQIGGLGNLGASGLVAMCIIAILTGMLRPKSNITEIRADMESRIEDYKDRIREITETLDTWKEAFHVQSSNVEKQKEILENLMATVQILKKANALKGGGDDDKVSMD